MISRTNKNFKIASTIVSLAVLAIGLFGCGVMDTSVNQTAIKYVEPNSLRSLYTGKVVGKLEFFAGEDFKGDPQVQIYAVGLFAIVGRIDKGEGYAFYLPENDYKLYLAPKGGSWHALEFSIKGGETIAYRLDKVGQKPSQVPSMPKEVKVLSSGSLYYYDEIMAQNRKTILSKEPNFEISHETKNRVSVIKLDIKKQSEIDKIYVNGIDKTDLLGKERLEFIEDLSDGVNEFGIRVVNKQGYASFKKLSITVLSEAQKIEIAERDKQEKVRREKEELSRKLEEERILREGDGSPDDLLCKKYGLNPLVTGYAECRMRIDFAKAETKRQHEQYERAQAEYDRQVAVVENERERQRALRQLELGLRMMGGQSPVSALNSLGTGMPIAPTRPSPINQTITLPGGKMINCTTLGPVTNCF